MAAAAKTKVPGPRPPQCRSLLTLQNQLASGMWAERHLHALAEDQQHAQHIMGLLECARDVRSFVQTNPNKPRQAQTRNLVCVCNTVCPELTVEWVQCFRDTAKKAREGTDMSTLSNCDDLRRRLDECTQYASSRLVHGALLPSSKTDMHASL